jgi:hypothetical protein
MKRFGNCWLVLLSLALVLFLLPAGRAAGVELNFLFDLGNLGFEPDRSDTDTTYSGQEFFWGGAVEVVHSFSANTAVKGGFYRDPVLRNFAYALLYYNLDFFSLGVGTIQGFLNSTSEILKPGIASEIQLSFPGVMFARIRFDTSLGVQLMEPGDYTQSRNELSIGVYVPNAICSVNFESKKFIEQQAAAQVVDSLMRYSLRADIYQKNVPYRLHLSLAYQSLQKKYLDAATTLDTLNSVMAGVGLDVDVTRYLTLLASLDSAVFTAGEDQLAGLSNPAPGGYLFQAQAGVTLKLDKLKTRRRPED